MKKEWYIRIKGQQEGPYSLPELKRDIRITPDTLVWKEGFPQWLPARNVPELKELFEEKEPQENEPIVFRKLPKEEEVIAISYTPPQFTLWLLIVIAVIIYVLYRLYDR